MGSKVAEMKDTTATVLNPYSGKASRARSCVNQSGMVRGSVSA